MRGVLGDEIFRVIALLDRATNHPSSSTARQPALLVARGLAAHAS